MKVILILLVALFLLESASPRRQRDASLEELAVLFNNNSQLFQRWRLGRPSKYDLQTFIRVVLSPWVFLDPPAFKIDPNLHPFEEINCSRSEFSAVFTGVRSATEKFLVDFIPFGYDIDLLEVRLFETYDVVDVFVIYESPRTQSGWEKPLYFKEIQNRNNSRFKVFEKKILYLSATDSDLSHYLSKTLRGLSGGRLESFSLRFLHFCFSKEPFALTINNVITTINNSFASFISA